MSLFVVLISSCIVVTYGFIAPSGIPGPTEYVIPDLNNSNKILQPLESVTFKLKKILDSNENLKNNNIDEKELFEDPKAKQNNVNERSFIILKQRYKTPVVNQLFSSQLQNLNKPHNEIESVSEKSKTGCKHRSQKQKNIMENKVAENKVTSQFGPSASKNNSDRNVKNTKKNQIEERIVNDPRQYLELLKPPLLRPLNKESHKTDFNAVYINDLLLTNVDYSKYNQKQPTNKNQFLSKLSSASKQQIQKQLQKYSYGFPSPYQVQRSAFRNNELSFNPEDINSDGSFAYAIPANLSPLEINGDDEKLDRFIKDTLEEQGMHEISNIERNKCNSCHLNDGEEFFNDFMHRSNCNCEPKVQNQGNAMESMEKERGEKKKSTVVSANNDYEKISTDESNQLTTRMSSEDNISTTIDKMNYNLSI